MKGEKLELWQTLCAQAAIEKDPKRLIELVKEINQLLSEKQERLNRENETTLMFRDSIYGLLGPMV